MNELENLRIQMQQYTNKAKAINYRNFFKNSKDDLFLGITAATIRKIAKEFSQLTMKDILVLMKSNVHDERSIANAILCRKFNNSDDDRKTKIFNFFIKNRKHIRDWDGVDDSAPYIVGPYLINRDKSILYKLAESKRIWDRRIAIVSTLYFIRQGHTSDTLQLAKLLLDDQEDLIHKAVGWTLREVGKKNVFLLKKFLNKHHKEMPRTMLRYAIERLSDNERKLYLIKPRGKKS
jgi:3-methyladenine DNA glycosylase AlkD